MSLTLAFAAAIMAQSAGGLTVPAPATDAVDVGYSELLRGDAAGAIAHISASSALARGDAVAFINLGSAYAMLGRKADADAAYSRARHAERFDVELSDGRWVDSRAAAVMAERSLDRGKVLALR